MRFHVGTSGYGHKEWKGVFYPMKMPPREMLGYYAQRFSTVEINNSFYKMPDSETVESWAQQVPKSFRFVIKAPQTITHRKRLQDVEEATNHLLEVASVLKKRQGPLFFQLPPNFKKDLPRLEAFLNFLGKRRPAAFEFRHESWQDAEVFDCLRAHSAALCIADTDEIPAGRLVSTARWGYVRLRRAKYRDAELAAWIKKLRSQKWAEAYIFFKHEATAMGTKLATRFLELADE